MSLLDEKEVCKECGSEDVKVTPTLIDYEDGRIEENHDTQEAKCQKCGKEWLVIWI